jgi:trimethylamine:corrinoid methyltransferase-like protein
MTRRRARNRSPASDSVVKPKAQQLFNPYEPIAALDPESLDLIHDASMRILEDIGLE